MNIYVGNLPYKMTEEDLKGLFAEFGSVKYAKIIIDRESGRSKGFGFVEMNDDGEAEAAIEQLNGEEFEGRNLRVNEARPREDRPRRPQY